VTWLWATLGFIVLILAVMYVRNRKGAGRNPELKRLRASRRHKLHAGPVSESLSSRHADQNPIRDAGAGVVGGDGGGG
jgi:hypothetical protein